MALVNSYENGTQWKTCRCGEGDTNIWTTRTSDNPDKQIQKCPNCQVLKSGPLFLSSKGIGWTSWKKRWFILTRTSLVFYRSDPNATPQKGSEAILTLGGLDLNNSGSVVVKADKKLLTVLFPDGRDGRTFTLKAETSEDLFEWKTALENALAQSPSPVLAMGQNGIFPGDKVDSVEASSDQLRDKDKQQVKSLVVGRPILLALEDIDGSPSFLEKALRFIEEHGISVEGILRQSADVEEVKRRVREYEQGNDEFSESEDAHVVCDCVKLVLRELQSSPVPAICCTALVEAYRADRGSRINAMRAAIAETFPEPNRRLVQRILKMMQTVASHKSENRMSLSAVAACMAPLLLRPLLAGDCELEDDFDMGGDGSIQLLQAAAAANHAQAIVIILLEEYERIFDDDLLLEGSLSSDLYSVSEDDDADDDESTDNDITEDDEYNDLDNSLEADIEDDLKCSSSGTLSESNSDIDNDSQDHKASDGQKSTILSPIVTEVFEVIKKPLNSSQTPVLQETSTDKHLQRAGEQNDGVLQGENSKPLVEFSGVSHESFSNVHTPKSSALKSVYHSSSSIGKCTEPLAGKRPAVWGRTSARKNLSMESIDLSSEDEFAIQRLEMTKSDLQNKIAKEVNGNVILQASLEKRKDELQERRLALEQDLEKLREQLQKEIELRECLEAGLRNLQPGLLPITSSMDNKTRVDLEEIALAEEDIINLKQKVTDLREQLTHQRQHSLASLCKSCTRHLYSTYISLEKEQRKDVDSTMPVHRNEYSSKIEVNAEDVKTQIPDSPAFPNRQPLPTQNLNKTSQNNMISAGYRSVSYAEEPYTFAHDGALKNSASRDVNPILGKNVNTQPQDPPSSPDKQFSQTLQSNTTNQSTMSSFVSTTFGHNTSSKESPPTGETMKKEHLFQSSNASVESSSISCADESAIIVHDAASKMSASRDNNSMPGVVCENVKTRSLDSPSSPDNQFSQNLRTKTSKRDETVNEECASQNMITAGPSSTTYAGEQKIMSHNALSKKPPSKDENSMLEEVSEDVKTQTQDSPSSPDKQSPQKLQPNTTNQSNTASKKSSFRADTIRKETQDPQSLSSRQFSEKQLSNTTNPNSMKSLGSSSLSSSEEMTTVGRSTAVKKSITRGEETASTSSALAKLTNRLNFLKERRVQLVNELQNLDASRTSGSEGLPRTNSM